jgi:hypothetical protein
MPARPDDKMRARSDERPAIMMLPARHYVSDHTKFIRELMEQKPQLEEEQKKARARWWDKRPQDLAEREKMDAGRVPQGAYVYQNE